jgi:hypothetical protein
MVVEEEVEEIRSKVSFERDEGESGMHSIPCGGGGREKKTPLSPQPQLHPHPRRGVSVPWERIDTTKQKKKKKRVARREPPLLTCKIKRACKQKIYTNNKSCKK